MKDLIFFIIEGETDERFLKYFIKPLLKNQYSTVAFYQYSQEKHINFEKFINYLQYKNIKYIILGDIDDSKCITQKKQCIIKKTNGKATVTDIIIVIKEIESWFLAGLSQESLTKIGITKQINSTDNISSKMFIELIPEKYKNKILLFYRIIMRYYDHKIAIKKNTSYKYFMDKMQNI